MNFNNTWRNYLHRSDKEEGQLFMHAGYRAAQLLAEGRKEDAKKRFPISDNMGSVDNLAAELRGLFGPRGVSKYIMFASGCLEEFYKKNTWEDTTGKYHLNDSDETGARINVPAFVREIFDLVRSFHTKQQRLEEKDINKYTFDSLTRAIGDLPMSRGEQKRHLKDKKLAEKDSEMVYNDHGIIAVRPLTTQASCYYGENPRLTTWCISTKSKRNYFDEYTRGEGKSFVIVKFFGIDESHPEHIIALQFLPSGEFVMFWDAPNERRDIEELEFVIGKHLYNLEGYEGKDPELIEKLIDQVNSDLLNSARDKIRESPTSEPLEYAQEQCAEIEREFSEKYEYVTFDWNVSESRHLDPEDQVEVLYAAEMEIVWDLDKPEYEDDSGQNFVLQKFQPWPDSTHFEDFKRKYQSSLTAVYGHFDASYDLSIRNNLDGVYLVAHVRKEGYDTYFSQTPEGFREFAHFDAEKLNSRGEQMQEMLGKMINWEFRNHNSRPNWLEKEEIEEAYENSFYKGLELQLLGEEKGRSRQRGIYKFYCMIAYNLTTESEKSRGLDDILADLRAIQNVTIVTVAIRNQKVAEGRYIAGLSIKFIPSTPGEMNTPENVKARIVRDIKRLSNVQSLFKLSTGLIRLE